MKGLKIVVLAKQVPDTRNVGKDAMKADGTVNRAALPAIFNPEDLNALEQALRIKDKIEGTTVHILTMGPGRAAEIIREAMYRGADGGYLLSDRAFAGSDTLATSYALACALRNLQTDLLICGRQAIDGDTAQVGPEMAEHLGIPQITGALKIDYADGKFVVVRENESSVQTLACAAPLLVTVTRAEKEPRFASIKGKMKARKAAIPTLTVADLAIDAKLVGLSGSPTKVKKVFTPEVPVVKSEIINEEDIDKAVDMLFDKLVEAKIITR